MAKAKITDIKVDLNKRLTGDARKAFTKILEDEFINQTTELNLDIQNAKNKVLDAYKKKIGFTKLINSLKKARAAVDIAQSNLLELGLDEHGQIYKGRYMHGKYQGGEAAGKLSAAIDAEIKSLRQPRNAKNKIITRLHMATTMGEAAIIMNEVLGNGLLPAVTQAELLKIETTVNEVEQI